LECRRWNDKGEIVLETDFKGKQYPIRAPLSLAYESYQYGDQRKQFFPSYSFASAVANIPANITKDWEEEIKGLFCDMGKMPLSAVKSICLGKWIKMLGVNNPHAYAGWEREVSDWQAAQKAIDAFVVARKGWEYLVSTNLQDPKHKREMSNVLEDILAKADAVVAPSMDAIREQDRRLNIRRDATSARNDVTSLKTFFSKYGQPPVTAMTVISNLIDGVEKTTLENGRKPKKKA
jgi:hypothetical protein